MSGDKRDQSAQRLQIPSALATPGVGLKRPAHQGAKAGATHPGRRVGARCGHQHLFNTAIDRPIRRAMPTIAAFSIMTPPGHLCHRTTNPSLFGAILLDQAL